MSDPMPGEEYDGPLPGSADWCGCWTCDQAWRRAQPFVVQMAGGMIVCPLCGNKRCPRAAHHDNGCTRSNKPGQPGSGY
jgi:hypothetical protein